MHPHRHAENDSPSFAHAHPRYVKNEKPRKDPLPTSPPPTLRGKVKFTEDSRVKHNEKIIARSKALATRAKTVEDQAELQKIKRRIETLSQSLRA